MTDRPAPRHRRARTLKVLVTGPFDAGKTTFIRTISEMSVLSTERPVSGGEQDATTTVAMDFGRITVGDDLALYLFGTPGQERFEFMWDILAEGILGYVFVVDGSKPASFDEARRIQEAFEGFADVPRVVAVTRLPAGQTLEEIRVQLAVPSTVAVVACDAHDRQDVKAALVTLLCEVRAHLTGPLAVQGGAG